MNYFLEYMVQDNAIDKPKNSITFFKLHKKLNKNSKH